MADEDESGGPWSGLRSTVRCRASGVLDGMSEADTSTFPGKLLKLRHDRRGYLYVNLKTDAQERRRTVHQLVCEAFHGRAGRHGGSRHLDGSRDNNRPGQPSPGDAHRDMQDIVRHGHLGAVAVSDTD